MNICVNLQDFLHDKEPIRSQILIKIMNLRNKNITNKSKLSSIKPKDHINNMLCDEHCYDISLLQQ